VRHPFHLFKKLWASVARGTRPAGRGRAFFPRLEALEDRRLLSTFQVTNSNDSGLGSLRQAILDANAHPNALTGPDTICFSLPAVGLPWIPGRPWTPPRTTPIRVLSALPVILDPVVIDGTTQPIGGIALDGSLASTAGPISGLQLFAPASTVRGLVISGFSGSGIDVRGASNVIAGNFIGTDRSGTLGQGNGQDGVRLEADGNEVGGLTAADRNVISGNAGAGVRILSAGSNHVDGNFIGTDRFGTGALGNGTGIILDSAVGNTIGTPAAGTAGRNLISGNTGDGIDIIGGLGAPDNTLHQNLVWYNYIGTDATGTQALGNFDGVRIDASSYNHVGASTAGNVIAGNRGSGVVIEGKSSTGNLVVNNGIGSLANGNPGGNQGNGVYILQDAHDNAIGTVAGGNWINFNGGRGVFVETGKSNRILSNSIFANGNLGIDAGPSGLRNAPVIVLDPPGGGQVTWHVAGTPGATSTFIIQFFVSPAGGANGQRLIGTLPTLTLRSGDVHSGTFALPAGLTPGQWLTATVTEIGAVSSVGGYNHSLPPGGTSDFSIPWQL
jgi:hypothetical protein